MLTTKVINTHTNQVYTAELSACLNQQSECLIGRHPNCDLILDGPAVSRVHGRILFELGQCFFSDLGSTDGSRLNNEEIQVNRTYKIAPDDVIRMGEFALIIEELDTEKLSASQIAPSSISQSYDNWSTTGAAEEITVRCMQIIQETHDVKTFRFVAEPKRLFYFKPGQFVTLKLPITTPNSQPVRRSYSISSSPSRPNTVDITVKRVRATRLELPPGLVSNWLHDQLEVGMTLSLQGPYGDFNCIDHPADKLLLISAGSGITPMMSIAQWLSDLAANTDIAFIHVARTPLDLIFRQRLELLAVQHPHFQLAFTLTQKSPAAPTIPWSGYRGRLTPVLLSAICPDFMTRTAFVCGPASFMASTRDLLAAADFPMENYFEESFGSPPGQSSQSSRSSRSPGAATAPSPADSLLSPLASLSSSSSRSSVLTSSPTVEFATSGKTIPCDATETLLDIAEQAGIALASGCRMGSCGACKQPLAAGEVCYDIEPRGLSASDRATGHVLTCIAKPVGKVVLAL